MKHDEAAGYLVLEGTRVEVEAENDFRAVRFRIRGEIDHHGAKRVREEMDEVIAGHHPSVVRMELGSVDFMDSAGLGLMLGRYSRIKEYGGSLILVNPTPGIMKILALAGADKLFPMEFTERIEKTMENREESVR